MPRPADRAFRARSEWHIQARGRSHADKARALPKKIKELEQKRAGMEDAFADWAMQSELDLQIPVLLTNHYHQNQAKPIDSGPVVNVPDWMSAVKVKTI